MKKTILYVLIILAVVLLAFLVFHFTKTYSTKDFLERDGLTIEKVLIINDVLDEGEELSISEEEKEELLNTLFDLKYKRTSGEKGFSKFPVYEVHMKNTKTNTNIEYSFNKTGKVGIDVVHYKKDFDKEGFFGIVTKESKTKFNEIKIMKK